MPKRNQYHLFGFANDVRVTAANKHLGLPPWHPHRRACGGETAVKPDSASSLPVLATLQTRTLLSGYLGAPAQEAEYKINAGKQMRSKQGAQGCERARKQRRALWMPPAPPGRLLRALDAD